MNPNNRSGRPPAGALATLAPALQSRDFRLFWLGQIVSTMGTSLQVVAEGYLIYQITNSTFWLGMVNFIGLLPVVPIALLGGVLIDRLPRRRLILATQAGLMLQALTFGLLVLSGRIELWHIILLYFLFGSLLAIDHPARRAFLVELVGPDELANAVALNATIYNFSSLVGYALSGLLIATIGVGGTMLANAATYTAPLLALSAIRLPDVRHDAAVKKLSAAMSEGLLTLWRQPVILAIISLMAVVGGLAWPVFGLMPAYAEDVMGTNAVGLGLLLAAGAFGSVLGTLVTARLGGRQRGRALAAVSLLLPLLVMGVAYAPNMLAAVLCITGVGLALLVLQSLAITLVQVHIPDRVRGRVMSIYSMLHAGADTGGNMAAGWLAVYLGLPLALALGGLVALVYALGLLLLLPALRRLE
ncbi:MAG: MFS transporter [Ardenticatenaceae bacterium]|nr:MFS transporter [Ardenticatenaceae bacterium]